MRLLRSQKLSCNNGNDQMVLPCVRDCSGNPSLPYLEVKIAAQSPPVLLSLPPKGKAEQNGNAQMNMPYNQMFYLLKKSNLT